MKAAQETDAFKKAREQAKQGFISDVPDGDYVTVPVKAAFQDLLGKEMVKWAWLIVEGDYANKTLYDNSRFETDENIMYFLKRLYTLGVDIDNFDISEVLKDTLEAIVAAKSRVDVTVKRKGEFQNVYVNRLLDDGGPAEPSATTTTTAIQTSSDSEPPKRTRTRKPAAAAEPEAETVPEREDEPAREAEPEREDEPEEVEVEPVPGTRVKFTFKGETIEGEITAVSGDDPETAEFTIKCADKTRIVKATNLIAVIQ
jgi:hypothetical protein